MKIKPYVLMDQSGVRCMRIKQTRVDIGQLLRKIEVQNKYTFSTPAMSKISKSKISIVPLQCQKKIAKSQNKL